MRNAAFSGKVAKDVSRQHALTVSEEFEELCDGSSEDCEDCCEDRA